MMAQDSLDRTTQTDSSSVPSVSVFVDLEVAAATGGELGAHVEFGPRVGPDTLRELLCGATVQIVGLENGRPVVTSDATRDIPPAIRRMVARRDGGCVIDGCRSRYRLEPHHVEPWAYGGDHDPDNLATVCSLVHSG